ncbi:MAG: hypothetical protein ABIQ02_06025, partial [Saprospiraceae bacterium]
MFNKLFLLSLLLCPLLAHGTPDVSLQIQSFKSESTPYIEVSVYIVGSSLKCVADMEYGVEYWLLIKDSLENIITGHHYKLSKAGCPSKDLIDVKRFSLKEGKYTIEVEMHDVLDSLNSVSIRQETEINGYGSTAQLSDIQLLSAIRNEPEGTSPLHKSGLYLEPLAFNYYYPSLQYLNLYIETYDVEKLEGQPFIRYTIKSASGNFPAPVVAYRKVKKEKIAPNVFQLDISKLISGPYLIEAALFDGNKVEVARDSL